MYVRKFTALAVLGFLAAIVSAQTCEGTEGELASDYSAIAGTDKQGANFGWIPDNPYADSTTGADAGADAGTDAGTSTFPNAEPLPDSYTRTIDPERAQRRESLRRSYRERRAGNPYARSLETISSSAMVEDVDDCDCGPDCICPPLVCKDKWCKKNYVFVVSAPAWCVPCKQLHPTVEKLRKDGYKIFYFDVDKFPDLDAKFDVTSLPTSIIFDNGKEVARATGIVSEEWFKERLKTVEEQNDKPEPKPDSNPYDILVGP